MSNGTAMTELYIAASCRIELRQHRCERLADWEGAAAASAWVLSPAPATEEMSVILSQRRYTSDVLCKTGPELRESGMAVREPGI